MNNLVKRVSCVAMVGALVAGVMTGCGAKTDGIDGTKTAVTVNGEKISLGEVSFYAHYSGANLYTYYYNYFGMTNLFDTVMDEETGQTYGENMSTSAAEELTDMTLLKQHAEEYGVVIDDEAKAAIEAAAQAYIDENDEEVRAKIGASKEDVVALMERQTYQSLMYDALAEKVDTEVSDEESQQTSVSYVSFALVTEDEMDDEDQGIVVEGESEEETAEEDEAGEETAEEDEAGEEAAAEDESGEETQTLEEQNSVKWADAEVLLAALKARSDSMTTEEFMAVAKEVNDTYSVTTETFTKADPTDTTLDVNLVEAATGLDDGTVIPNVIEGEDSAYIYVAIVDKVIDESATEEKKEEIITSRKQENYDNLLAEWKESAEITTDEEALALVVLTDSAPVTFKQAESAETAEEAEAEVTEEAETAEDETAEAADADADAAETAEAADAATADAADAAADEAAEAATAEAATAETADDAAAETAEAATTETADAAAAEAATTETADAAAAEAATTETAAAETADAAAADAAAAETAVAAAETAETASETAEAAAAETAENAG